MLLQRIHISYTDLAETSTDQRVGFHPSFLAPIATASVPASKLYRDGCEEHSYPPIGLFLVLSPLQLHMPLKAFVKLLSPSSTEQEDRRNSLNTEVDFKLPSLPAAVTEQVSLF
jgi:hypothetical protein